MAEAPGRVRGLCHVALRVRDVRAAAAFYREHFDMRVVWSPDPENVYLSSGHDNLALHQVPDIAPNGALDHLGFLVDSPDEVHAAAERLRARGVPIARGPRPPRRGSVPFSRRARDATLVQFLGLPAWAHPRRAPPGRWPPGEFPCSPRAASPPASSRYARP